MVKSVVSRRQPDVQRSAQGEDVVEQNAYRLVAAISRHLYKLGPGELSAAHEKGPGQGPIAIKNHGVGTWTSPAGAAEAQPT